MSLGVIAVILGVLSLICMIINYFLDRKLRKTMIESIIEELNDNITIGEVRETKYYNAFNYGLLKAIEIVSKHK